MDSEDETVVAAEVSDGRVVVAAFAVVVGRSLSSPSLTRSPRRTFTRGASVSASRRNATSRAGSGAASRGGTGRGDETESDASLRAVATRSSTGVPARGGTRSSTGVPARDGTRDAARVVVGRGASLTAPRRGWSFAGSVAVAKDVRPGVDGPTRRAAGRAGAPRVSGRATLPPPPRAPKALAPARERALSPNDAPRAPENLLDQLRLERRPPRLWRPRRRDAPPARRARRAQHHQERHQRHQRHGARRRRRHRDPRDALCARRVGCGSTRRVRPGKRDRSDVFDSVSISTVRPRNSPSRESNDFRPSRETYGTRQRARAPPAAP